MKLVAVLDYIVSKIFSYDKWNIGHINQSPEDFILKNGFADKVNWLTEDNVDYAADPFAVTINGRIHLYYEELSFWRGKGEIMMLDSMCFKHKRKVSGLANKTIHLSYPNTFLINDKLFCMPETAELKEIALYQMVGDNPQKFKKLKVIIQGEAFVDSSIIFYDDSYWLFTSISSKKGALYIFKANDLMGDFEAHEQNPITVSNKTSRSAGCLFLANGKLYMPSQNSEKCYGGSVMINEITKLTQTEFQYQPVFEQLPQPPYNQGLHTINFCDGLLIVDGKRKIYSVTAPIKKMIKKIRNLNMSG